MERAETFAQTHGAERAYGSYAELIADPDVELIYVATPHPQHHAIALAALRAGKGVLVEKAFTATLEAAGKSDDDVILVSVDGGCEAIKRGIRTGEIDATSQQYPENMASKGVEAVAEAARGCKKPSGYLDTGVRLIAADRVDGVASEGEAFGVRNCWGD